MTLRVLSLGDVERKIEKALERMALMSAQKMMVETMAGKADAA